MPRPHHGRNDGGFTLIELLVVIIVIGILAAIAMPVFLNQRKKAQGATLKSELRNVSVVVESWYADGNTNANIVPVNASGYMYQVGSAGVFPGTGELKQAGMDSAKVSTGTGVIVLGWNGGYCVAGARRGSVYDYAVDGAPSGPAEYGRFLFYDSLAGGVMTRASIPTTGACAAFR